MTTLTISPPVCFYAPMVHPPKKDTMRTTIDLPVAMWEALKVAAVRERVTMKQVVITAIDRWLKRAK